MADYLTSDNPTIEDWLKYNEALFEALRQGHSTCEMSFAFLTDLDSHAAARGISVDELFAELQERVGDLGTVRLKLSHSDMDNAWHVGLTPKA